MKYINNLLIAILSFSASFLQAADVRYVPDSNFSALIGSEIDKPIIAVGQLSTTKIVAVGGLISETASLKIYSNDGSGGYSLFKTLTASITSNPKQLILADFNGDGDDDLLIRQNDDSVVYLEYNAGSFIDKTSASGLGSASGPLAIGEINGSAGIDILLSWDMLSNDGSGIFNTNEGADWSGISPSRLYVSDVDGDTRDDVLAISDNYIKIYRQTSTKVFTEQNLTTADITNNVSAAIGDYDKDSKCNIMIFGLDGYFKTWEWDGSSSFADVTDSSGIHPILWGPSFAKLADVNKDGNLDLFISGEERARQETFLYKGNGSGSFERSGLGLPPLETAGAFQSVNIVDVDGDGTDDLFLSGQTGRFDTAHKGVALFRGLDYTSEVIVDFENSGSLFEEWDMNRYIDIVLSKSSVSTVTADWEVSYVSADSSDVTIAATGQVSFAPGETNKPVNFTTKADVLLEGNESFVIKITNASVKVGVNSQIEIVIPESNSSTYLHKDYYYDYTTDTTPMEVYEDNNGNTYYAYLSNIGGSSFYMKLDKRNNAGAIQWSKTFGAGGNGTDVVIDDMAGLACDSSGNVYFACYFKGTFDCDPSSGVANLAAVSKKKDIAIIKLSSAGDYIAKTSIGGLNTDVRLSGMICSDNEFYLYGSWHGTGPVNFSLSGTLSGLASVEKIGLESNFYVLKFGSDLSGNWLARGEAIPEGPSSAITVDHIDTIPGVDKKVAVIGRYKGDVTLSADTTHSDNSGNHTGFIVTLSKTTGDYIDSKDLDTNFEEDSRIRLDSAQNFYVLYEKGSSFYFGKIDGSTNLPVYAHSTTTKCFDISLTSDALYLTGALMGKVDVDLDPSAGVSNFKNTGLASTYISKYALDGTYQWSHVIGGTAHTIAYRLSTPNDTGILLQGMYQGVWDNDPSYLVDSDLTRNIYDRYFALRLKFGGLPEITNKAVSSNGGNIPVTGDKAAGDLFVLGMQIKNDGGANLSLSSPVLSSATNCTVSLNVNPVNIAPSVSQDLKINITPTASGSFSFGVSIANNDADENPFTFTVTGNAVGGAVVTNTRPSISDFTLSKTNVEIGEEITFSAKATDKEDGDLSSSIYWYSSVEGSITSSVSSGNFTPTQQGVHIITAKVYDSKSLVGMSSKELLVKIAGTEPSLEENIVSELPVSTSETNYTAVHPGTKSGFENLKTFMEGKTNVKARLGSWNALSKNFVESPSLFDTDATSSCWNAYFLASRDAYTPDFKGKGIPLPYSVPLLPGWNFIGLPVAYDDKGVIVTEFGGTEATYSFTWVNRDALSGSEISSVIGDKIYFWNTETKKYDTVLVSSNSVIKSGVGFWIKNQLTDTDEQTIFLSVAVKVEKDILADSANSSNKVYMTKDLGTPPPPGGSVEAADSGSSGCGLGSVFGLMILGLFAFLRKREE